LDDKQKRGSPLRRRRDQRIRRSWIRHRCVAFFAQQQAVDNFGLANCGGPDPENP
jgi:hypothetical protein